MTLQESLSQLERLYHAFQHSAPSADKKQCTSRFFGALSYSELTPEDLAFGQPRHEAMTELHTFFDAIRAEGGPLHQWPTEWAGKYFWQSPVETALVIRKDWIEQTP